MYTEQNIPKLFFSNDLDILFAKFIQDIQENATGFVEHFILAERKEHAFLLESQLDTMHDSFALNVFSLRGFLHHIHARINPECPYNHEAYFFYFAHLCQNLQRPLQSALQLWKVYNQAYDECFTKEELFALLPWKRLGLQLNKEDMQNAPRLLHESLCESIKNFDPRSIFYLYLPTRLSLVAQRFIETLGKRHRLFVYVQQYSLYSHLDFGEGSQLIHLWTGYLRPLYSTLNAGGFSEENIYLLPSVVQENPYKERVTTEVYIKENSSATLQQLQMDQFLQTDPEEQLPLQPDGSIDFVRSETTIEEVQEAFSRLLDYLESKEEPLQSGEIHFYLFDVASYAPLLEAKLLQITKQAPYTFFQEVYYKDTRAFAVLKQLYAFIANPLELYVLSSLFTGGTYREASPEDLKKMLCVYEGYVKLQVQQKQGIQASELLRGFYSFYMHTWNGASEEVPLPPSLLAFEEFYQGLCRIYALVQAYEKRDLDTLESHLKDCIDLFIMGDGKGYLSDSLNEFMQNARQYSLSPEAFFDAFFCLYGGKKREKNCDFQNPIYIFGPGVTPLKRPKFSCVFGADGNVWERNSLVMAQGQGGAQVATHAKQNPYLKLSLFLFQILMNAEEKLIFFASDIYAGKHSLLSKLQSLCALRGLHENRTVMQAACSSAPTQGLPFIKVPVQDKNAYSVQEIRAAYVNPLQCYFKEVIPRKKRGSAERVEEVLEGDLHLRAYTLACKQVQDPTMTTSALVSREGYMLSFLNTVLKERVQEHAQAYLDHIQSLELSVPVPRRVYLGRNSHISPKDQQVWSLHTPFNTCIKEIYGYLGDTVPEGLVIYSGNHLKLGRVKAYPLQVLLREIQKIGDLQAEPKNIFLKSGVICEQHVDSSAFQNLCQFVSLVYSHPFPLAIEDVGDLKTLSLSDFVYKHGRDYRQEDLYAKGGALLTLSSAQGALRQLYAMRDEIFQYTADIPNVWAVP